MKYLKYYNSIMDYLNFDINSVSSVLSNNENEGISTLSLNDLETIKIIVEEDS